MGKCSCRRWVSVVVVAHNGGPTWTCALQAASPAIDQGVNPLGLVTDQRRGTYVRQSGTGVDIGAFEYQVGTPNGFAQWASGQGLSGDLLTVFGQDYNHDGVPNGLEYAFGTNWSVGQKVLDIQIINGHTVVEYPHQDPNTTPFVSLFLQGCTNLLEATNAWTLPVSPSSLTSGKPADQDWFEPQGSPSTAFFRLRVQLLE